MATTSKANSRKSKSGAAQTWVYRFADVDKAQPYCDGSWDGVRGLLGGKGANLAEMTRIGVADTSALQTIQKQLADLETAVQHKTTLDKTRQTQQQQLAQQEARLAVPSVQASGGSAPG